jgi:hypothetical protein
VRRALGVAGAQEQVDQRPAGLLDRGADRGEGRVTEVRSEDVVVADHAYLTRDVDPEMLQPLQHADGEQVVERDKRGRLAGHADVSRRRPALQGRRERSSPDHFDARLMRGGCQRPPARAVGPCVGRTAQVGH